MYDESSSSAIVQRSSRLKRRLVKNYCLVTFHSSSSGTRQRCLPSNLYSKMCKVCA